MNHGFNVDAAKHYGVNEAIVIESLVLQRERDKVSKNNFYDNKFWFRCSIETFSELFPYWSRRQIQRVLENLKKKGCVEIGNYNKTVLDHTKWYSLTETVLSLYKIIESEA